LVLLYVIVSSWKVIMAQKLDKRKIHSTRRMQVNVMLLMNP
jgi:hypothetical protein